MPVDNNKPRSFPHPTPEGAAEKASRPKAKSAAKPEAKGGKQVRFAERDSLMTYVKGEGVGEHFAPHGHPAKRPAPEAPATARDAGCSTKRRADGRIQVLWPSGQRYEGSVDPQGAPHGVGKVTTSEGHVLAGTRWNHGTCEAVGTRAAPARDLEAYRPPTKPKKEPRAAKPGAGSKLLSKLRDLTKSRDKGPT